VTFGKTVTISVERIAHSIVPAAIPGWRRR
jgi:hypothetical protein